MAIRYVLGKLKKFATKGRTPMQQRARKLQKTEARKKAAAGLAATAGVVVFGDKVGDLVVPYDMRPRAGGGWRSPTPEGNFPSKQREACLEAQAANGHVDPSATSEELAYFYED